MRCPTAANLPRTATVITKTVTTFDSDGSTRPALYRWNRADEFDLSSCRTPHNSQGLSNRNWFPAYYQRTVFRRLLFVTILHAPTTCTARSALKFRVDPSLEVPLTPRGTSPAALRYAMCTFSDHVASPAAHSVELSAFSDPQRGSHRPPRSASKGGVTSRGFSLHTSTYTMVGLGHSRPSPKGVELPAHCLRD